jgi:membrane-associated phospholipid phosphatase
MILGFVSRASIALCLCVTSVSAQDTTARPVRDSTDTTVVDSLRPGRAARLQAGVLVLGRRSLALARQGERIVFGADSAVDTWTRRQDPTSSALRKLSPIAFWVPVAAVATAPVVWADEAQDGHILNAQYARSVTAALAMGFIASRTTKHFIHRARPCTGSAPGDVFVGVPADSLPTCPKGGGVGSYASFFSEHTMALFAIASAATFQAQRQRDPRAATVAAISFTSASVFSLGRIYQQHHWLSDVLVGAAVGTATGFVGAQLGPKKP